MRRRGLAGAVARAFIDSKLTPLLVGASVLLGLGAVVLLPREEEPQIVVPLIDVFVEMPGASAREVQERITRPMEKLLWEIPGVEYIYSTSSPGRAMSVVRFYVGEDEEAAIVRLNQKLFAHLDLIPPGATLPLVKPRSIDDVPILALTLWSDRYDHYTLRRVAAQLHDALKQVPDVSEVKLTGGLRRQLRITVDPERLAARGLDPLAVAAALQPANRELLAGPSSSANRDFWVEGGGFLRSLQEVEQVVVGVFQDRPVYLRDVALVQDGPEEPDQYVLLGWGEGALDRPGPPPWERETVLPEPDAGRVPGALFPAVTLSVAKRKGTNATRIARAVLQQVEEIRQDWIPQEVHLTVTRNYGETAREKSDELLFHMLLAILSVSLLIGWTLGFRDSGIVAIAIPVTLALTLVVFYFFGYTLNRVTLFALIFSIGILVDDAIVVVENIVRHRRLPENRGRPLAEVAVEAVDEVGNPTILATLTVIAAIVPMAFVSGLMGPYMRPIPVGASAAMFFSLLVAFVVTPWASRRLLAPAAHPRERVGEDWSTRLYRRMMEPLIQRSLPRWLFLAGVVVLLGAVLALFPLRRVVVKMLPFDNKSEFQVVINLPEGTPLEETAAVTREMADYLATVPEVTDFQLYIGSSSPYNFNGLVRHYFLRQEPHQADIQVNLLPRHARSAQSHEIARRVRPFLQRIASRHGAAVQVAEVPPGPPVLQTLVAEIYGPDYRRQQELATRIQAIFEQTEGVVDVDSYLEAEPLKFRLEVEREKAALNGLQPEQLAATLQLVLDGKSVGLLHRPEEKEDVPLLLRLGRADRSRLDRLLQIQLRGAQGLVPLKEVVQVYRQTREASIYHKNLLPVVYVTGDVAGREESPVYAMTRLMEEVAKLEIPEGYRIEQYTATLPPSDRRFALKWDGEWHITYEVFRDLGLAFAAVLILIYILVVGWFQSLLTPLVIMAAIPFSLVGILPAHWMMGAYFTATSMIGFIAGAGIVVRNSIILVDFVELRLRQGMPLHEAVVDAGAVRFRPMMLTAAAVIVGASVILFDPIFQGLALSLMAGEIASLFLSRLTVPVLYFLAARGRPLHSGSGEPEPQQGQ